MCIRIGFPLVIGEDTLFPPPHHVHVGLDLLLVYMLLNHCRNILENFGHLLESDKSILMKYPFHRVGSLLSPEEAQCSSIVKETLARKAEGEGPASRMQLLQPSSRNSEEFSTLAEAPQVL